MSDSPLVMIMARCSSGTSDMALMSSNVTGPARIVVVRPWLGVAQAIPMAMPPNAHAAQTPANTNFDNNFRMVVSFGLRSKDDIAPRAQTERRGDAGPVKGLLGGKASPAALAG